MENLLVITSRYPHKYDSISGVFVKSQIDEIKHHFNKVIVISTTPLIPKIISPFLEPKRRGDSLAENYSYDNVDVFYTKEKVYPTRHSKKFRGEKAFRLSMDILKGINFQPDIIHAHYTWPSGFIAMKLKQKYNVPVIVTVHGYDVYDLPFRNSFYFETISQSLNSADSIISVSKENENIMKDKLGISSSKIHIIPNGFNPHIFHRIDKIGSRNKVKIAPEKKVVVSVGYLAPEKGQKYLLEAARKILRKRKDIIFYFVGRGSDLKMHMKFIEKNNLKNNVFFVGAKPHKEIPIWMNASDLLVLPSLTEGVPTVLFEGMACGKPFVCTNVGGIPDIIRDDSLGLLVPSKNPKALAVAIEEALSTDWDDSFITEYSKQYSWTEISNRILKIYETHIGVEKNES